MPQPAKYITLLTTATRTTTGTGNEIVNIENFTACRVRLRVGSTSGTSPTLNMYVQHGIRTTVGAADGDPVERGTIEWDDFISFTQVTTNSTRYAQIVAGGNAEAALSAKALTAGTVRNGPLGSVWRVAWTSGGTNPSMNFDVIAELIP